VAIARALANDPPILVADEPTGSLDSITSEHIFELFDHLKENGKTIVMVTHDKGLSPRFTRTLTLQDGEIISNAAMLPSGVAV
jgi:putative ABC transport system ATP-binding protein